jgi:hypothetical protein
LHRFQAGSFEEARLLLEKVGSRDTAVRLLNRRINEAILENGVKIVFGTEGTGDGRPLWDGVNILDNKTF